VLFKNMGRWGHLRWKKTRLYLTNRIAVF